MNGIAFGVIITGATVWAASTLGVLALGLAARRKDPRVVIDDPWERPEVSGPVAQARTRGRRGRGRSATATKSAASLDRRDLCRLTPPRQHGATS